jgi:hypothetical protein
MANLSVQLSGASLLAIDQTGGITRVNSPVAAIAAATQAVFYDGYFQVFIAAANVTLPLTPLWVIWIKNLSPTATINITLTPNGGTAWVQPLILVPGAAFTYWAQYSANPATGGVSVINLSASANNTPVELLIAG